MRLIDADSFLEFMIVLEEAGAEHISFNDLKKFISEQRTEYDIDSVVERLEEYAHSNICNIHEHGCPYLTNDDVSCENCGAMGAVEIVKSYGVGDSD